MMHKMIIKYVVNIALLSTMVQYCSPAPASIAQHTINIQKQQQAAKQQQSSSNNLAFALQDHRSGGRHGSPTPRQDLSVQGETANLSSIQPVALQFCFRAIQFIQKTAEHVQQVTDITNDEQLPIIIAEIQNSAQKAFIYSEIAIGLIGEPVIEAVNITKAATITARNAANAALKVASAYSAQQPGSENSHKAVQAAQRSTLTAQSAQHQILQAGTGPF